MEFLPVGSIIDPSRDRFATTGAHGDFRIIPMYGDQRGQRIDPATRPELLGRIFAGNEDNRRPITSYPMTSGFGRRPEPIEGASTFHQGQDYAIPAGVPLYIQGATDYFSQNGVGVAKLNDAQGRPYEIELFHTKVGEPMNNTLSSLVARGPVVSKPVSEMGPFDDYRTYDEKEFDESVNERWVRFDDYRTYDEKEFDESVNVQLEPYYDMQASLEDVKKALLLAKYQPGGQPQEGANSKGVQDMQRSMNQMISALRSGQTEEQRTRLALDKAVDRAAAAFQSGKSVI